MSTEQLDDEFEQLLHEIESEKANLAEDEQNVVDAWLSKLKGFEDDDEKQLKLAYLNLLKFQITRTDRHLSAPYSRMPPDSKLPPLEELLNTDRPSEKSLTQTVERRRYLCSPPDPKPPCRPKSIPLKTPERPKKSEKNDFEDPEEMAKSIARSKGMSLAEFVADISRHTADKGSELRAAMLTETTGFKQYVQRIMTQRVKDLAELLDQKQNQELLRIQKDYDQWQSELSFCKTELKAIVPDFDIDDYRKDRNYLRKFFSVSSSNRPAEDKLKEWKDENGVRLMCFINEMQKLTEENNQVLDQISSIKAKTSELERQESQREQCHVQYMHIESGNYKRLREKHDKLAREITDLLMSQEN